MDSNNCQIIKDSLAGKRAVDERTFESLAILRERLNRLKRSDIAFCDIEFSSAVKRLKGRRSVVAV